MAIPHCLPRAYSSAVGRGWSAKVWRRDTRAAISGLLRVGVVGDMLEGAGRKRKGDGREAARRKRREGRRGGGLNAAGCCGVSQRKYRRERKESCSERGAGAIRHVPILRSPGVSLSKYSISAPLLLYIGASSSAMNQKSTCKPFLHLQHVTSSGTLTLDQSIRSSTLWTSRFEARDASSTSSGEW